VRGVGDKPSLRLKRHFETLEQSINRVAQLSELIAWTLQRQTVVQAVL
jgi:hypothetical protein